MQSDLGKLPIRIEISRHLQVTCSTLHLLLNYGDKGVTPFQDVCNDYLENVFFVGKYRDRSM